MLFCESKVKGKIFGSVPDKTRPKTVNALGC